METDEATSPIITTTIRDSGLFVAFNIKKTNNIRRDSGLEVNDLDRLRQSRSNDILGGNDKDPTFVSSTNLDLEYRDSGSPIRKNFAQHSEPNFVTNFGDTKNEESIIDNGFEGKKMYDFRSSVYDIPVELKDTIMINGSNENLQENLTQNICNPAHKIDVAKIGVTAVVVNDDIINSPRMKGSLINSPRWREIDSPINSPRIKDEIPFTNYKENRVLLRKKQNAKEREDGTSLLEKKPPRPNSCRPNSASRVAVSSRVEVMLKSDLFKKYLSKHEDLIDKIAVKQGRGTGLKKALSNLDVSQLGFDEDETETDQKSNLNATSSFNDESLKTAWENSPSLRTRRNTYSEADFNSDKENVANSDTETKSDALHQSQNNNPLKIKGSNRQKFAIPSFHEFKMSKQFKNIPEEVNGNEDDEESCENCDKNRMCEDEKKKSRSHSRCQRIREKYSQNHEDGPLFRTSELSVNNSFDNCISNSACNVSHSLSYNNQNVNMEDSGQKLSPRILMEEKCVINSQKTVRKSEIPVPIKMLSLGASQKETDLIRINHEGEYKHSDSENQNNTNSGLPPRHLSDMNRKRVILRASRKRKMGHKKPFLRSQSDSQLKIDSASCKELPQRSKSKPPPLEMRTVHSLESFSEISASSSPMLSAPCYSPASAVSFDFSTDQIVKFGLGQNEDYADNENSFQIEEQIQDVLNDGDNIKYLSGTDNSSANLQTYNLDRSGKDNSSAILQVELWSDNSDKQTISSTSDCSDKNTEEFLVHSENSSQTKCILDKMNSFLSQHSLPTEDELLPFDAKSSVTRSTSDVCDTQTSDALQKRRERKERPYKSDPFTGSPYLPAARQGLPTVSIDEVFEDVSLEEVEEEDETSIMSEQDWERERKIQHRLSDVSSDSGVVGPEYPPSPTGTGFSTGSSTLDTECSSSSTGSNTVSSRNVHSTEFSDDARKNGLKSPRSRVSNGCKDCGNIENNNRTNQCSKCEKKSVERKEIILEIKETENSYGRDLVILKEHFYKPMKSAGLLSMEHLEGIFLNLDELIHVNSQFVKKLQSTVDTAAKKGDENLKTVSIGNLFLDSSSLILAFENYCVNQGQAAVLLEQLEREKELLRIFLQVSQDENPILRRMPFKSFLVVPVQRITRYPLLLERLYKFTSGDHVDKSALMEAKLKIEDILDHINSKTKHGSTIKIKRKITDNMFQRISITEKIEVNKVATEVLGWNRKEVCDIIMCRLQVAPLSDQTWAGKRLKTMKFTTVHCVMLTLGQSDADITDIEEDSLLFGQKSKVIQAAVVLIKEKNGKYQTLREPFILNRCVVSVDPDVENAFELSDLNKEPYVFKGDDIKELKSFVQTVKQQTLNLGVWRKRRNALPNIMIKHVV